MPWQDPLFLRVAAVAAQTAAAGFRLVLDDGTILQGRSPQTMSEAVRMCILVYSTGLRQQHSAEPCRYSDSCVKGHAMLITD